MNCLIAYINFFSTELEHSFVLPCFVNSRLITSFISLFSIGVLPYALFAEVFFNHAFSGKWRKKATSVLVRAWAL